MRYLRAALARVAGVFTGHRADDDLRAEMEAHLEMEIAEYVRRGMGPEEMEVIADALTRALESGNDPEAAREIRRTVSELCAAFPLV